MLTPLSLVSVIHTQSGELGISDLVAFSPAEASPLAWLAVPTLLAYWAGAIRLWQVGRGWSLGRTLLFTLGCVLWFLVCGLSLNAHANVLVSALLFQQITLMVVVPPFLLMGSPGRLLLSSVPHGGPGRWILRAALGGYRSRAAQLLLHPAAAIVIALLAFPGFYFSDGVSVVMATPGGHTLALLVFLLAGVIAGAPLWALDPLPRTPSYVVRLVDVVLEIQIHAIFGLILLLSTRSLFAWYAEDPPGWGMTRALDQAIAGGLIWSYGELPLLIVLIVTLSKWRTSDERRARRRRAEEDAELDEYNAYLAARYGTRTESVETDGSSASRL